MLPICLQGDGFVLPARAQQNTGGGKVEQGSNKRNHQANAHLLQRFGVKQPESGRNNNGAGSKDDEQALECTGKILCLAVAIGMFFISWSRSITQHDQCQYGPGQIDQGLHCIGQQADRTGEQVGPCF